MDTVAHNSVTTRLIDKVAWIRLEDGAILSSRSRARHVGTFEAHASGQRIAVLDAPADAPRIEATGAAAAPESADVVVVSRVPATRSRRCYHPIHGRCPLGVRRPRL